MEIHHKIKPLHGWREFIGEVGIIVFGVLIALGAEQVVEAIHWHEQVQAGRDALASDLSSAFANAKERELYSTCLSRRFREIAVILDDAQRTNRLPPVGDIGGPSKRQYNLPSWGTLSATGAATHLPRAELVGYGSVANYAAELTDLNTAEFTDWSRLHTIVGPGRATGPAELGELRAALSEALYRAKLMRLGTYQLKTEIKHLGVKFDPAFVRDWAASFRATRKRIAARPICRPLGPAPDHYGSAPLNYSLDGPIDQ